jgi:prolyl-tRNA synthetase
LDYSDRLAKQLNRIDYHGHPLRVKVDHREERGGEKIWHWIKKGVPIRIEIGLKEIQEDRLCIATRTGEARDKIFISREEIEQKAVSLLDEIQNTLYMRAQQHLKENTHFFTDKKAFFNFFHSTKENEIHGGFAQVFWAGSKELEDQLKKEHAITIRCIPLSQPGEEGICLFTGEKTHQVVLFAKAY